MPDIVVMFFVLGLVAGLLKSDLSIPKPACDTLSLLLMLTIGLKGGTALHGALARELVFERFAVALLGAIIPFIAIPILLKIVNEHCEYSCALWLGKCGHFCSCTCLRRHGRHTNRATGYSLVSDAGVIGDIGSTGFLPKTEFR